MTSFNERTYKYLNVYNVPIDSGIFENGVAYIVIKRGGTFRAIRGTYRSGDPTLISTDASVGTPVSGTVYRPLKPGTKLADVEGATEAIDDGTHWHLTHAQPHHHRELKAVAEAFLISHLQPVINEKFSEVYSAADITARTIAHNHLLSHMRLFKDAQAEIAAEVDALWLGQHVQEGHEDIHRKFARESIKAVLADWKLKGKTDVVLRHYADYVEETVTGLVEKLSAEPSILTRIQHEAAEAAKKAAETQTPAEGN